VTDHISCSEEETVAIGRTLGATLDAGATVLLSGPLGAGKTAFTRGLVEGLGGRTDDVSSPTFTILQAYEGRVPVQHADLYRLSPAEVEDLALEEVTSDAVLVVEWPDRWGHRPPDAIVVEIEMRRGDERRIRIYRDSTR
jgi:tRNA threonylcarbamoyl adenosine modification protein YjeE